MIPVMKHARHYRGSPFLFHPIPGGQRSILMSFKGDLGLRREGCKYSRWAAGSKQGCRGGRGGRATDLSLFR